jgi:hypothetical protein
MADHNYNQASRESVYAFLRRHLWGEKDPGAVKEAPFTAADEKTLSTWDDAHPRPSQAADPARLKGYLRSVVDQQVATLRPTSAEQWRRSRRTLQTALGVMLGCELPKAGELEVRGEPAAAVGANTLRRMAIVKPGEVTAATLVSPTGAGGLSRITVVVHPLGLRGLADGESRPGEALTSLLGDGGARGVLVVEPFLAGQPDAVAKRHGAQYYTTYNKTVLAERVQDILNAVAAARTLARTVDLVGLENAGPWVLLARPFAGDVRRTAADANGWEWPREVPAGHEMLLPAVHRYGGMKAFAALSAGRPVLLYNHGAGLDVSWLQAADRHEGRRVTISAGPVPRRRIADFLNGGR